MAKSPSRLSEQTAEPGPPPGSVGSNSEEEDGASHKEPLVDTTTTKRKKPVRSHIAFAEDTIGGTSSQPDDSPENDDQGPLDKHEMNGKANGGDLSSTPGDKTLPPPTNGKRNGKKSKQRTTRHRPLPPPTSTALAPTQFKRRKRGRVARVVAAVTTAEPSSTLPLPGNQYSTILRRRAIRKLEDKPENSTDEDYGDISLGMKLIVAGGKVIVQTLNALADGRASPAQLTGVIQRGDVLVGVGDVSLASLPIDQLMTGLKPLSSPEVDGRYRRFLRLRLEAGVGLELLKSHERGLLQAPSTAEAQAQVVSDMFALFPMVDQLSGAPLIFEQHSYSKDEQEDEKEKHVVNDEEEQSPSALLNDSLVTEASAETVTPDELISALLAKERQFDREHFTSEYFNWSEGFSKLLKASKSIDHHPGAGLTKTERIELGLRVMKLARSLTYSMEDLDKGKDLRSFKTWSTNFSLRSSASARRRHVMDAVSLRSNRSHPADNNDFSDDSVGSAGSGSLGSVDPDALLLGLAAHDDIWRKQVLDALKQSIEKMENGEDPDEESDSEEAEHEKANDINEALTNELGAFLFGENVNRIIKKKKKSYALPPADITTVLFDLTTHIATAAPDEVTIFGGTTNSFSLQSSFGTQGKARAQLRADILLANRFILDEVLPLWLESFRPLGLEQRRLFWPKMQHGSLGSYANTNTNTHTSDNDSLTVDSHGSAPRSGARVNKNLQEIVEDLELDIETRAETCFLVTYYFTQQILSRYTSCLSEADTEIIDQEVATFVQKFGTYLQIHSCLAFSARVEADRAVDELLKVAKHDPLHRDAAKEIQNANDMTFYDVSKLTAVLESLRQIRYEKVQRRRVIINLCVAAYPDIQPWQIKRACLDPSLAVQSRKACSDDVLRELYYSYLSQLLDPVEGQEAARQSAELIKEWCEWSIGINDGDNKQSVDKDKMQNFYRVASKTSSAHLAYQRDLPTLLEMSMTIKEYNLALELTSEIIEDRKLCGRSKTIHRVLACLRVIGVEGLVLAWESREKGSGFTTLKRVLRAFNQMSQSEFNSCRDSIDVPHELLTMLEEWNRKISPKDALADLLILVDFMIQESAPIDVLSTMVLWSKSNELGPALFGRLDHLLRRGVQVALKSELSGSLLRLKHMRRGYTEDNRPLMQGESKKDNNSETGGIWKRMSLGTLTIDK